MTQMQGSTDSSLCGHYRSNCGTHKREPLQQKKGHSAVCSPAPTSMQHAHYAELMQEQILQLTRALRCPRKLRSTECLGRPSSAQVKKLALKNTPRAQRDVNAELHEPSPILIQFGHTATVLCMELCCSTGHSLPWWHTCPSWKPQRLPALVAKSHMLRATHLPRL